MQIIKTTIAAAAFSLAVLLGGGAPSEAAPLSAAPLASMSQQLADETGGGSIQKVHYRRGFCWRHPHHRRCRNVGHRRHYRDWRSRCAERWGWHTPRYRRCLSRHGY